MKSPLLFALLLLPALQASAGFDEPRKLEKYARKHAVVLDWKAVVEGQTIVYLGEKHPTAAIKTELAAHMADFKEAGFTHLALEMLGDDMQGMLDQYCAEGQCAEELEDFLSSPKKWGWAASHYMKLMAAAKAAGLKLAAIDVPADQKKKLRSCGKEACELKMKACAGRDCRMASHVWELVKDQPGARVLVLVGNNHLPRQQAHLDRLHKRASLTVRFLTGEEVVYEALKVAGWDGKRAYLPIPPKKLDYGGAVLIPEVVAESR